jgi:hypothetical protein
MQGSHDPNMILDSLPIIAITYFLTLTVDFSLLWLSVRSGDQQLALAPPLSVENKEKHWLQYGGDGTQALTNTPTPASLPYPLSQSPSEKYFDSRAKGYPNPHVESSSTDVEGSASAIPNSIPRHSSSVAPKHQGPNVKY